MYQHIYICYFSNYDKNILFSFRRTLRQFYQGERFFLEIEAITLPFHSNNPPCCLQCTLLPLIIVVWSVQHFLRSLFLFIFHQSNYFCCIQVLNLLIGWSPTLFNCKTESSFSLHNACSFVGIQRISVRENFKLSYIVDFLNTLLYLSSQKFH